MRRQKISVRIDEHTLLVLEELAELTGRKLSVVIRMLVIRGLEELTDSTGHLHLPAQRDTGRVPP